MTQSVPIFLQLIRTGNDSGGPRKIIEDLISEILVLRQQLRNSHGQSRGKGGGAGDDTDGGGGITAYRAAAGQKEGTTGNVDHFNSTGIVFQSLIRII